MDSFKYNDGKCHNCLNNYLEKNNLFDDDKISINKKDNNNTKNRNILNPRKIEEQLSSSEYLECKLCSLKSIPIKN